MRNMGIVTLHSIHEKSVKIQEISSPKVPFLRRRYLPRHDQSTAIYP
jgi:hypothetical protein